MRMTVVKALCDLVKVNLKWVPTHILRKVADRLRDKKVRSLDVELSHLHLPKYPLQFVIW